MVVSARSPWDQDRIGDRKDEQWILIIIIIIYFVGLLTFGRPKNSSTSTIYSYFMNDKTTMEHLVHNSNNNHSQKHRAHFMS